MSTTSYAWILCFLLLYPKIKLLDYFLTLVQLFTAKKVKISKHLHQLLHRSICVLFVYVICYAKFSTFFPCAETLLPLYFYSNFFPLEVLLLAMQLVLTFFYFQTYKFELKNIVAICCVRFDLPMENRAWSIKTRPDSL